MIADALVDEEFEVAQASDAKEALIIANENTFDLALIDIRIPDIDGIEVLKIFRKQYPTMDCIVVTGYQDLHLAVEAIKLGAKDFLSKPLNIKDLINRFKIAARAHFAELHLEEQKARFTSKLLHDLLAPLHTIQSSIDFLDQETAGPLTEQQRKTIHSISDTAKIMDALLNDMIDLNLFESGRVDIEKIPTNFDEIIPAVCARFIPRAAGKRIDMTVDVDSGIPTVAVDPIKIEQVMNNLLDNAIKYTPNGGYVTIKVSTITKHINGNDHEFVEVAVSDSGVGISRTDLPFVFDKYKELLTGKSSQNKTTGLGLTICRSIIEAHGGSMSVESIPGSGSTFKFHLPI